MMHDMDQWEPFKPQYDNAMVVFMLITTCVPVVGSYVVYGQDDALKNEHMFPALLIWGAFCLIGTVVVIHTPFAIPLAIFAFGAFLFAGVCFLEMRQRRLERIIAELS